MADDEQLEFDFEEPGNVPDAELGVPGEAEPMPTEAEEDEPTSINDDEEEL